MELELCRTTLLELLENFNSESNDLREKVLSLVPMWDQLREMGSSIIPSTIATSARDRILHYALTYPKTIISNREFMIISGISEWPRRVRELRVEFGWALINGITAKEMQAVGELREEDGFPNCSEMTPNEYIMLSTEQDRDAAHRWNIAKTIRNGRGGAKARILDFFKANIGVPVSGEELRYVAKGATEWARRVRELRTEDGWQICTHWQGRPDLASGVYVLESSRQLPSHDRSIDDAVRRAVMVRDNYTCKDCQWTRASWNPDDPRHLELHHIEHHVSGGSNAAENLVTLCNVCHDVRHR
ncbi:HNH endonuclease [Pontiellaceae bacterium B12219]|nr:HNH endonuclease [Pontiellaceae bacterium B12219]